MATGDGVAQFTGRRIRYNSGPLLKIIPGFARRFRFIKKYVEYNLFVKSIQTKKNKTKKLTLEMTIII